MPTLNTILKELKDVPVNRLEELSQFIHALTPNKKQKEISKQKILSFGGAFKDMKAKEYNDFLKHTKNTRTNLMDRNITL